MNNHISTTAVTALENKLKRTKFLLRKCGRVLKKLKAEEKQLFIQLSEVGLDVTKYCTQNKDKKAQKAHISLARKKIKQTKIMVSKTQENIALEEKKETDLANTLKQLEIIYETIQKSQNVVDINNSKPAPPPFLAAAMRLPEEEN